MGLTDIETKALKGGRCGASWRLGELPQPAPGLRPDLLELFERVVAIAPAFSTRRSLVRFLKEQLGIEYSHRTIERWDLPIQYVGGRATFRTVDGLARVFGELNDAPIIMAGRRPAKEQHPEI
jgi:hypothetical protein